MKPAGTNRPPRMASFGVHGLASVATRGSFSACGSSTVCACFIAQACGHRLRASPLPASFGPFSIAAPGTPPSPSAFSLLLSEPVACLQGGTGAGTLARKRYSHSHSHSLSYASVLAVRWHSLVVLRDLPQSAWGPPSMPLRRPPSSCSSSVSSPHSLPVSQLLSFRVHTVVRDSSSPAPASQGHGRGAPHQRYFPTRARTNPCYLSSLAMRWHTLVVSRDPAEGRPACRSAARLLGARRASVFAAVVGQIGQERMSSLVRAGCPVRGHLGVGQSREVPRARTQLCACELADVHLQLSALFVWRGRR